jgi:translocation and assembly module TamB
MREREQTPPAVLEPDQDQEPDQPRTSRRYLRHLLWTGSALTVLMMVVLGLFFYASSDAFENIVRKRLVARLETATGGRVEIAFFHWHLLRLEAEADGIVIHGLEAAGEAPYAKVGSLRADVDILGVWSPRILLRKLEIVQPRILLIVYPDGSTNQPHPRAQTGTNLHPLDAFFDLQAGRVSVEQGMLDVENRAANFDFQNRSIPLDFAANELSLRLAYVAPNGKNPESYHVQTSAHDLSLLRGSASHPAAASVQGYLEATLDLTRNAAYLRSLRLTAYSKGATDHVLNISGQLTDFSRPHWQATARGELDLRLMEPITGYPFTPEGIARIDLAGQGFDGQFRADGSVHTDGAAYVGPGVNARGVSLDAHVHADPERLLITSVVARLRQGGQLEGEVLLDRWIAPIPGTAVLQATPTPGKRTKTSKAQPRISPPVPTPNQSVDLHTNGKVKALLKSVSLDTVLDIVGQRPFQRLGINALLNGLSTADWTDGDVQTLTVSANLGVSASGKSIPGESPANGAIDATYTQRDGAVALRKLEVALSASQVRAHGHLGAYPLSSPSSIAIDFQSHDLGEFDTLLRDLGLTRNGKTGAAALPISLGGNAEFHGTWAGSVMDPHIAGNLQATNLSVEVPAGPNEASGRPPSFLWDSLEASGSYSAARISIDHSQLRHGAESLAVNGTLTATSASPSKAGVPSFDSNSLLHAHLHAVNVDVYDLQSLLTQNLPVTGSLTAQIDADGPILMLNGSGWVQLDNGVIYGEPVARVRAQGKMVDDVVQLASVTLNDAAGKVVASGTYDLHSRRFQVDAHATGIDIAKVKHIRDADLLVAGNLGFSVTGSGTFDDPRLEGHASLTDLTLSGEPFGGVDIVAHTANRNLTYDITTRLEAAEFIAHGRTELSADYATEATLDFSHFNIGSLLRLEHVSGISGESALAGRIILQGPLAKPEQIRGEARLQELAVSIAGVHLRSDGNVHATLAAGRISLDPLHVTGEETDLHVQGSLSLKDKRQLDLAANGSINLKLAETIDPDLTASGTSTFRVEAHGTLKNPGLTGQVDFKNASLALEDLPNSLSQLNGTLEFNQDRLEVKSLTAMSGGGLLSVSGYLAYRNGIYADLSLTGKGIRIRYPQGVSSAADINLQLQGPQNNLLLHGGVLITRFTISPEVDFVALAAQAGKAQPLARSDAPSNHIRLDIRVQSSPQLNFQNAYAKLAGDVDLHVRGTLASPSLLGRVSITEGSATIAGTRYELQRGEITFTNPVRIQPNIDLNATARVEDYDITLGLHGSIDQLAVSYRSSPPLPEADVVALLALGRTQDQQRLYTQQQQQLASNPATDALLGGALNATVSSRVQRLFGAGSVKVDPSYLGALGNSTTRITVEEQLGKNLTLTYATDVDTTAQQLLQAEIAINRHVSLLVARDESGVFSMVLKATRRFR